MTRQDIIDRLHAIRSVAAVKYHGDSAIEGYLYFRNLLLRLADDVRLAGEPDVIDAEFCLDCSCLPAPPPGHEIVIRPCSS